MGRVCNGVTGPVWGMKCGVVVLCYVTGGAACAAIPPATLCKAFGLEGERLWWRSVCGYLRRRLRRENVGRKEKRPAVLVQGGPLKFLETDCSLILAGVRGVVNLHAVEGAVDEVDGDEEERGRQGESEG